MKTMRQLQFAPISLCLQPITNDYLFFISLLHPDAALQFAQKIQSLPQ